jgi:hypothetical protein
MPASPRAPCPTCGQLREGRIFRFDQDVPDLRPDLRYELEKLNVKIGIAMRSLQWLLYGQLVLLFIILAKLFG